LPHRIQLSFAASASRGRELAQGALLEHLLLEERQVLGTGLDPAGGPSRRHDIRLAGVCDDHSGAGAARQLRGAHHRDQLGLAAAPGGDHASVLAAGLAQVALGRGRERLLLAVHEAGGARRGCALKKRQQVGRAVTGDSVSCAGEGLQEGGARRPQCSHLDGHPWPGVRAQCEVHLRATGEVGRLLAQLLG
jgi:hypothetical protein